MNDINTPDLRSRGLLVIQTLHFWTAQRHDSAVSAEVEGRYSAARGVGRFAKSLVARESLKDVRAAESALRLWHEAQTLAWGRKGLRLLPTENFLDYKLGHAERTRKFDGAADKWCAEYQAHINAQAARAGGLFDVADYPPADRIRAKFGVELSFFEVPANDFRVSLAPGELAELSAARAEQTSAAFADATRDCWQRLHKTVTASVESLRAFAIDPQNLCKDGTPKVLRTFRDSAVTNIREQIDLLAKLNVTGDPELQRMRERLAAELVEFEPAVLREDSDKRATVISRADRILADMAAYLGEPVDALPEAAQ